MILLINSLLGYLVSRTDLKLNKLLSKKKKNWTIFHFLSYYSQGGNTTVRSSNSSCETLFQQFTTLGEEDYWIKYGERYQNKKKMFAF